MGLTNWKCDIPTTRCFHLIFFGKEGKKKKNKTKMKMKKKKEKKTTPKKPNVKKTKTN